MAKSQPTTSHNVALTSGNLGLVRMPMLLLLIMEPRGATIAARKVRDSIGMVLFLSNNRGLSSNVEAYRMIRRMIPDWRLRAISSFQYLDTPSVSR